MRGRGKEAERVLEHAGRMEGKREEEADAAEEAEKDAAFLRQTARMRFSALWRAAPSFFLLIVHSFTSFPPPSLPALPRPVDHQRCYCIRWHASKDFAATDRQ